MNLSLFGATQALCVSEQSALVTRIEWAPTDNGAGASPDETEDAKYALDWKEAKGYCDKLSLKGRSDWRLPNIKEAEGLFAQSAKPQQPLRGELSIIDVYVGASSKMSGL